MRHTWFGAHESSEPLMARGVAVDKSTDPDKLQKSITGRSSAWIERSVRDRKVGSSNLLAPIILRNEPFGEYAEGLFHCDDASYRSTSVFKWHCTIVELTRRSDGTPLFAWRNVVQILSPVLAVADRSFEAELLRQFMRGPPPAADSVSMDADTVVQSTVISTRSAIKEPP
jgi:hypothetical protein